jgi:hypothetical protein
VGKIARLTCIWKSGETEHNVWLHLHRLFK